MTGVFFFFFFLRVCMESMEAGFLRGRGNRNDQSIYGENFYLLYFIPFLSLSLNVCLNVFTRLMVHFCAWI